MSGSRKLNNKSLVCINNTHCIIKNIVKSIGNLKFLYFFMEVLWKSLTTVEM